MNKTVLLLSALAFLAPSALFAARITEADLANDFLPLSVLTVTDGSRTGQYAGSYSDVLDEADNKRIMFKLSEVSTDNGCSVSFTLAETQHFTTYALRVAHSTQYDTVNRAPKKWEVYGSTDNTNWTLLSTEENETGWQFADNGGGDTYGQAASPGETRLYRFSNTNRYRYIRFKFIESDGNNSYILVTRIILYTSSATAETFAGCEDLVPASTSETESRYTSTTHPQNNNTYFPVGKVATAFSDDDPARVMMKNVTNGVANLIYEFGTDDKKVVNGYMVRFPNHQNSTLSRAPSAWTFAGSNDGVTWTTLDERDGETGWTKNEKRYYAFENHTAYAYYKIEFTANNGEDRDDYYYEFGNLDYYFRQPDGFFFTALDASYSDGVFTVSGALTADSNPAAVTLAMVTNGLPFVLDFGTVQPGDSFSTNIPFSSGVIGGMLTGIAGSHTNSIVEGPAYIPGADAARFVSPDGDDENAGTSLEAPMRHIADAVADLGASGGTVFVLPGTYTETNDFSAVELSAPVAVIGVTGNPADATVTQNATYKYARIFKLTHASALARSLTITGGKVRNEPKEGSSVTPSTVNGSSPDGPTDFANGGNIYMSAGLIENCVISGGNASRYACAGGNVWMSGGRLSRCVLVGGTANRTYCDGNNESAGSITATGGIVENCVIQNCAGGYVAISAEGTSKFLNCTVVGNTCAGCAGFVIAGNDSRVINTVIFDNSNSGYSEKPDQYPNPATGTCNLYIASKRKNNVPTDATTAFVNCATDGEAAINGTCRLIDATAFADYANGNYAPASRESPLVNMGADYAASGGVSAIDLAGNPRVWTSKPDIGAFEFQYERKNGTIIYYK